MAENSAGPGASYIEQSLAPGEAIAARFEVHWFAWFPMTMWIVLGFVSLGFTWWLALYEYLRLKFLEQGVTNRRVILVKGIFRRRAQELELRSIRGVEIRQGPLGRALGFATVRIRGREGGDLVMPYLDDPAAVKRRVEGVTSPVE